TAAEADLKFRKPALSSGPNPDLSYRKQQDPVMVMEKTSSVPVAAVSKKASQGGKTASQPKKTVAKDVPEKTAEKTASPSISDIQGLWKAYGERDR
ncbi:MAG: hypothetical protein J6Y93_02200, partial [Treponema sp.]|nr:hypothetical protein [Treponema sp.]